MRLSGRWMAAAAGLLLACSSPAEIELSGDVAVELDAFSGLPNPVWTLTPPEADELARRLRDLPAADGPLDPPEGLGYRGFWIRQTAGGAPATPALLVHGGVVRIVPPTGPGELRRDVHGVEAWLVGQARKRGYGGVFDDR